MTKRTSLVFLVLACVAVSAMMVARAAAQRFLAPVSFQSLAEKIPTENGNNAHSPESWDARSMAARSDKTVSIKLEQLYFDADHKIKAIEQATNERMEKFMNNQQDLRMRTTENDVHASMQQSLHEAKLLLKNSQSAIERATVAALEAQHDYAKAMGANIRRQAHSKPEDTVG